MRPAELLLSQMFLVVLSNPADACVLNGPQYRLGSDTVVWSLELSGGDYCTRSVRFNSVVIDTLRIVSRPQTGHLTLLGPGFSYRAPNDFQGRDFFSLMISGTANKVSGRSTIEVAVSVSPRAAPAREARGKGDAGPQTQVPQPNSQTLAANSSAVTGGLPPGVTLQHIDGGPTYYADHGFTNAVNMGWDSLNFFPIGPFDSSYNNQTDVNTWSALGWNTAFADGGINLSLAASHGVSVIEQGYSGSSLPSNVVGLLTQDEPRTFAEGVSTPLSTTANSIQDGRFWWMNDTWSWAWGQGLSGAPAPGTPASILSDLIATPNGTTRHIDINSIDMYWFAGSRDSSWSGYMTLAGQRLYDLSSGMTSDQSERGSNYGDMIDILRGYQAAGYPAPIYSIIEDGQPFTGSTNGSTYITPAELNWATWSSLIHGARGIIYFDHSFSGPGTGSVGVEQSYFQTVQPGQTISIYNQIKATDALIKQLTPVILAPFALNYVAASPVGYSFPTPLYKVLNGIDTMAKYYSNQFYVFATTRNSAANTNINARFTIADKTATSAVVVNESRSIRITNGVFSDTFAKAWTVHIYQINR